MLGFLFIITLLAICCCRVCDGAGRRCHDEERRALLEIKESINHPNGTALPDWRDPAAGGGGRPDDCCLWSGVTCNDRTGRVVDITLIEARTVEAPWYPNLTSLVHLRALQGLNLAWNKIGGTFPQGLCNLTWLKTLKLTANSLGGPIPQCLCRMRSLTVLWLSLNSFNGSIPPCLANLHNLEKLNLDANEFEGSVPASIFPNLTKLTAVRIGSDGLTGTFPFSAFANLSSLTEVLFRSNYGLEIETDLLSPSSWVPSFQLTSLFVIKCVLNKRINGAAGRFPTGFISTQTASLESLSLTDASMAGAPPLWVLCNSSLTYLDLSGNMLHGTFHLPCPNASALVESIELSRNRIRGSLPSDVGFSFPSLGVLRMPGNQLEGSIPPSLGQGAPLRVLDLSDNRLTGQLPRTLTTNQTTLQYLNLSYNQLHGEIFPGVDSHVPNLQVLYLQHNMFTGSIPAKTFNLTLLKALHLGHNELSCSLSSCLPRFPAVIALSLRRNRFQGPLPSHLCHMQQLQLLDLSGNNLSGGIPACLNNISVWKSSKQEGTAWWSPIEISYIFTNEIIQFTSKNSLQPYQEGPLALMTGLDVSSNRIDGVIPWEIGELGGLKSLNLSYNRLRGSLPESICDMNSLESLDLSHNGLIGAIPDAIVQLNFLSAFSVAFNNLSGAIPHRSQFSTFTEASYEGNPGLCGDPLERRCSSRSPAVDDEREAEDGKGLLDNTVLFYLWIVLSFGLGFWGFIATSVFCRRLRIRYYGAVDRFYNDHLKRS